jgi:poly-beta-1,6-N-acetyl-D-glucosamine synthase
VNLYFWIAFGVMMTYAGWMGTTILGGLLLPKRKKTVEPLKNPMFTVVIPFKNEAENLPVLFQSIERAFYHSGKGLVEVIGVDDHSDDTGLEWLKSYQQKAPFSLKILQLDPSEFGKKKAIDRAVNSAATTFIITIDADCQVPESWLLDWHKAFSLDANLYVGLVIQRSSMKSLSGIQQEVEGMMLQGITQGSASLGIPLLCSGANLGYERDYYLQCQPYNDNFSIASGDDMFFLQKAKEQGGRILAVNSLVFTSVASDWETYMKRSVRWSAKISSLNNTLLSATAYITFLANLFFITGWFVFLFEGSKWVLLTVLIKFFVDFFCLFFLSLNFKRLKLVIFAPLIAIAYPVYLLLVGVGQLGYQKKGWN